MLRVTQRYLARVLHHFSSQRAVMSRLRLLRKGKGIRQDVKALQRLSGETQLCLHPRLMRPANCFRILYPLLDHLVLEWCLEEHDDRRWVLCMHDMRKLWFQAGKYKESDGLGSCVACSDHLNGSFTAEPGSFLKSDCKCNKGFYGDPSDNQLLERVEEADGFRCASCPAGKYKVSRVQRLVWLCVTLVRHGSVLRLTKFGCLVRISLGSCVAPRKFLQRVSTILRTIA
jgi:hypothetical protein